MTVRAYYSTDASAPALIDNVAGKLIAVLDACLVNGYGAKAAAGWSKAYSGTNKAAYRQGSGSHQFYMRVDDTGTTSARVVGYESMSDVDTGSNAFPTNAQVSGGLHINKSDSSTARPWAVFATEKFAYIYIGASQTALGTSAARQLIYAFGDFPSYQSGDQYNTILIADVAAGTSSSQFAGCSRSTHSARSGHYVARPYTAVAGAVQVGKAVEGRATSSSIGAGGYTYPNPINNGMDLSPIYITEANGTRGYLPGLWCPNHNLPANHFDTFTGTGELAGKTFILMDAADGNTRGRVAIETSDTW